MIDINYRGVAYCIGIILLLLTGFVAVASAEPINLTSLTSLINGSYVVIDTSYGPVNISSIPPTTTPSRYIYQGETVYPGDILDISGAVAPYPSLAYWNGYDMYDSLPTYNISLPYQKSGWYNFAIDDRFSGRYGNWYKYDNKFERSGNSLAFVVSPRPFYNYTLTFQNGTMIYVSELPEFERIAPVVIPPTEIMPVKHISDYLVASDTSLNISITKLSAVWIFDGHDNSILYATGNDREIVFGASKISSLEPGNYKILIQSVGNISEDMDVIFDGGSIKWFDRSNFAVRTVSTQNLVPTEAIRTLESIFPKTYDTYQIKILTVQEPAITIEHMDQIFIGNAKEYYKDYDRRGNMSLMDVRGYTNVFPGTNVSVVLDEESNNPREIAKQYTYRTVSQGNYLGDMRYYRVYVPLYWDDLKPGMHTLTARTELGSMMIASFPVWEESPNSYVPSQTIKFMGDRNPWVPTPTPEIVIQKEQVVVTREVPVQIQPSEAQISEAAQKLVDKQNRYNEMLLVIGIFGLFGLAFLGWVGYSLWRAKR